MPVDLTNYSNNASTALATLRTDFEQRLNALQSVVSSIGWYGINPDIFVQEIGAVTFAGVNSLGLAIGQLPFVPAPQRTSVDATQVKTALYQSGFLDSAKAFLLSLAGRSPLHIKYATSLLVPDAHSVAISGAIKDGHNANFGHFASLLDRYSSPDIIANQAYLETRRTERLDDVDRESALALFELAQDSVQWLYRQALDIEQAHSTFTLQYNHLLQELATTNLSIYKVEVEAAMTGYEVELKKLGQELAVEALKFERESSQWKLKIQQANDRIAQYTRAYSASLGANLQQIQARIAGGANLAKGYEAIFAAHAGRHVGLSLEEA